MLNSPKSPPSSISSTSLYEYLSLKNGISQALGKRILLDIVEWITINLIHSSKVSILKLGNFTVSPDSNGKLKIIFNPYKALLNIIKEHHSL